MNLQQVAEKVFNGKVKDLSVISIGCENWLELSNWTDFRLKFKGIGMDDPARMWFCLFVYEATK